MKEPSERLVVRIVGGLKELYIPWTGSSLLVDLFRKLEMRNKSGGGNDLRKEPHLEYASKVTNTKMLCVML